MSQSWFVLALALAACPDDDPADPTDATDAATETTVTDTSVATETTTTPDTSDADTTPEGCRTYTFTGTLVSNGNGAFVLGGGVDLGFGDAFPDALALEFISNDTGTFELGVGDNDNFLTCNQCVRVAQDLNSGGDSKHMLAKSGTIVIDPSTPPDGQALKIELIDVAFVEVEIFADFHSEEVEDGECYEHSGSIALETAACLPACAGRVCGDNGCDGTCGAGCTGGDICALGGDKCEADPECFQLELEGGDLDNRAAGVYQIDLTNKRMGAITGRDFLQLEFYARATGIFDLAVEPNNDYATCKQCVRVVVDGSREFFQLEGAVTVTEDSDPIGDPEANPPRGKMNATLSAVRLVEVTYDEDFHASRVPDGACIDIISSAPFTKD